MTEIRKSGTASSWKWLALGKPPPNRKTPMSKRARASIQAPIMALIGWALFHFLHHRVMPVVIWSLAGLVLVGGWLIPPVFIGFEKAGQWLTKWVTRILNWALLVPFYYLCFVPGRVILLLRGIDPMDREFPSNKDTFWIPRKPVTDMKQYKKQH